MNKHFIIMPDGEKATRNSKGRIYSHAVAVRTTNEALISGYRATVARAREEIARYTKPGFAEKEIAFYKARGYDWESLPGKIQGWIDSSRKVAEDYEGYIAEAEAADAKGEILGSWKCVGWCGRLDLAEKLAAQYRGTHETKIIEAQRA